jgi:formamidopyrimidine-DNA glycosylase
VPELPEVETVRRTLEPLLLGRVVARVSLARRDIVAGSSSPSALLQGRTIAAIDRRGKHLALLAAPGPQDPRPARAEPPSALVVHLGMSGQLFHLAPRQSPPRADHIHCTWALADARGRPAGTLVFRDPRRFGGLTPFPSRRALDAAWASLGPDALDAPAADDPSIERLWRTARPIKAALLDQRSLAGIGNIYADEALFAAGIHPRRPARRLSLADRTRLLDAVRDILRRAIDHGGSTLRDYRDAFGRPGHFQARHAVYARGGQPCVRCGTTLRAAALAQRTTTWCPTCQPVTNRSR